MSCGNCFEPQSLWWQPVMKTLAICNLLILGLHLNYWVYLFLSLELGSRDDLIDFVVTGCRHTRLGPIITLDQLVSGMDAEHLRQWQRNIVVQQNMLEPFFHDPWWPACAEHPDFDDIYIAGSLKRVPSCTDDAPKVSGFFTVSQVLRPTVQFQVTDLMETDLHRVIYSKQAMTFSFGYRWLSCWWPAGYGCFRSWMMSTISALTAWGEKRYISFIGTG